ncbi:MAG: exopolysaccharide biosynthesis polyprenyl glycosylphosphotransferase, partial [Pseudomonadota bacterium]
LMRRLWVLPADIRLSAYSQDFAFRDFGLEDGPLIPVLRRPISGLGHRMKRAIDVLGAAGALLILAPALLAIALAVRLESRGPILFRQPRHGFNDQIFQVLKFRSMRAEDCDPEAKRIVVRDDPRVTRVGAILRRTSLDELPQLWNVLRGDMSLVGPRPHALEARSSREELFTRIVDGYSGRHRARPGITGLAQIEGWRGEVDGPEALRRRFEADLRYIENWSLWLDLRILASTVPALLTTTRAY